MDSMQNSSGSRRQHYRPASEFDEATLARKREYWRIKKREQRAKLSVLKKERLNVAKTTDCRSRASAGHLTGGKNELMALALGVPGPTLLKNDGTYEAGIYHKPTREFEKVSHQVETEQYAGPTVGQICAPQEGPQASVNKKDMWFQKIKLNNVLPTASSDSRHNLKGAGRNAVRCLSIGAVSGTFSPIKLNGALLNSSLHVPAIEIKVQQTGSLNCKEQNRKPLLNGSSSTILPQHSLAPQTISNLQDFPSVMKVPFQNLGPGGSHANVSEVPKCTQTDILESPIKTEVGDLLPDIDNLMTINSNIQAVFPKAEEIHEKEVVDRAIAAVEPVAPQQISKATIKKELDNLSPDIYSLTTTNSNIQAVFPKAEELNEKQFVESAAVEPVAPQQISKATACRQKLPDCMERWAAVKFRTQRQRFRISQRMTNQRSARRTFSPAVALSTRNAQRTSVEETDEDRLARKREYWRIKKREQRANLSVEVKAKMKERDSLLRRVKRYQCILEDMRRARVGSNKSQLPPGSGNILPSDNETIGGFIKEDGTMATNIPQTSAEYRLSKRGTLPESHTSPINQRPVSKNGSGNAVLKKHVQITAPPPLKCATQMKSTSYPDAVSSLNPPRLMSNRARPASHAIPKSLQNTFTKMPQTNNFLRRLHNVQSTYPGLNLLKQRQVLGKHLATPHEPGGFALRRVPAALSFPTMASNLVPELTEEERMAKKREYWRIKKREQRAQRSARTRQALFQSKYSSAIQRQQSQRVLSARRTASLNTLRGISAYCPPNSTLQSKPVMSASIQEKQANIKQEEEPGPTEDQYPTIDLPFCPEIKPSLSPAMEQQVEQDPSTVMDSQTTTLLAVASMKKLLEESLSSVADSHDLALCKREQVSSEVEVTQVEVKSSLQQLIQRSEGSKITPERHQSELGATSQVTELHPSQVQLPSCLKYSQAPSAPGSGFHETPVLSSPSQASSIQSPASIQSGSSSSNLKHSHTPLRRTSPSHVPSCSDATSSNQPFQLHRASRLSAKRIGHHCCSPEPLKKVVNSPSELCEDILRKKREYWRVAKREQRAKKSAHERELRKLAEHGKQQTPRPSQGAMISDPPELKNKGLNLPPHTTLHVTNSTPLVLSSATGTITCLKAVTTLPILKVFTPVESAPLLCSNAFERKAPTNDPPSNSNSSCWSRANSRTSLSRSTLPCPASGNSRGTVQSGDRGNTGQLLQVGSQQNQATGSSAESPQVKRWQMLVQGSADTPSDQPSLIKKLPGTALQVGGATSQGSRAMNTRNPPSCNVPPRVGQDDAWKPPDPAKSIKTVEQLDEDLRRKREYWRVKKKEQRARKAARERDMKRQGTSGGWRTIRPAKDIPKGQNSQGRVLSDPWPSSAAKDSQSQPGTSPEYSDQPQLSLTGAGKDELDMGMQAVEEDEEEREEVEEGLEAEEECQEDTPCSEASWRTRFLMDFDPLNQLLVCMVCGELQHSHSLEGVRGHIEEAHPDTLTLDPRERHRILEAWDEQVFLRERFFSNQLQQHSAVLTGEAQECPAEVEVLVDLEESPTQKNQSKASKTKSLKRP